MPIKYWFVTALNEQVEKKEDMLTIDYFTPQQVSILPLLSTFAIGGWTIFVRTSEGGAVCSGDNLSADQWKSGKFDKYVMKKDGAFMSNLMIFFLLRMGAFMSFYCYLGCCTNPENKLKIRHDEE